MSKQKLRVRLKKKGKPEVWLGPRLEFFADVSPDEITFTYDADTMLSPPRKVHLVEVRPDEILVNRETLAEAYGAAFTCTPEDPAHERCAFLAMAEALGLPEPKEGT